MPVTGHSQIVTSLVATPQEEFTAFFERTFRTRRALQWRSDGIGDVGIAGMIESGVVEGAPPKVLFVEIHVKAALPRIRSPSRLFDYLQRSHHKASSQPSSSDPRATARASNAAASALAAPRRGARA